MSTAVETREPTRVGTGIYTTMKWIVVDGIESSKPVARQHRTDPIFKFKDEFDDEGFPSDTGGLNYRHPANPVSEWHWLHCGYVVEIGSYCEYCGLEATE